MTTTVSIVLNVLAAVGMLLIAVSSGTYIGRKANLDQKVLSEMGRVCASVMTPCLIFSSIVENLTWDLLLQSWHIPVATVLLLVVDVLLAMGLAHFFVERKWSVLCIMGATFNNPMALPVSIIQSLSQGESWIEDQLSLTISLCFLFNVFQTPFFWMGGSMLIDSEKERLAAEQRPDESEMGVNEGPGAHQSGTLAALHASNEDCSEHFTPVCRRAFKVLSTSVNPPFVAALVSLVIAMIPPLQTALIQKRGLLNPLFLGIKLVGEGMIPLLLVLLGANLWDSYANSKKEDHVPKTVMVIILVIKLIVTPMIACAFYYVAGRHAKVTHAVHLVYFVEAASPTAVNLALLFGMKQYMCREVATVILYNYLLCPVTIAMWLSVVLHVLDAE